MKSAPTGYWRAMRLLGGGRRWFTCATGSGGGGRNGGSWLLLRDQQQQQHSVTTMSAMSLSSCVQSRVLRYDFFNRCFVVDVTSTPVDESGNPVPGTGGGAGSSGGDGSNILERRMAAVVGHSVSKNLDRYKDISDFCLILKLYPIGSFSPEFSQLFEDALLRFLSLPDQRFSLSDLTYLFHLISGTKRRPVKVMRRISELIRDPEAMHPIDPSATLMPNKVSLTESIGLMIYAMSRTMFLDAALLQHLCDILAQNKVGFVDLKRNTLTSLLLSLGQMRFRHPGLMDAVTATIPHISSTRRPYNANELTALINTLAIVKYMPPDFQDLVPRYVLPSVRLDTMSDPACIHLIWSLSFFKLADEHVVGFILNPGGKVMQGIRQRIANRDNSVWSDVAKIRQIRAVAVHEAGFTDARIVPQLDLVKASSQDKESRVMRSAEANAFATLVTDSLNLFIPKGTYMETSIQSDLGFEIDARFVVNANLKALSVEEVKSLGQENLPDGFRVVNVLTSTFRTTLLNPVEGEDRVPEVTGPIQLQQRLLSRSGGETVLIVDAASMMSKADAVARVNFLQESIRQTFYQSAD